MSYKNGFYIYTPNAATLEDMHELSLPQVIEIIEGKYVSLTGDYNSYDIDYAEAVGTIGRMVMSQDGVVT